jgi:hypothetical protein
MRLDRPENAHTFMIARNLAWSEVVVRGGVEPPTFRFSEGMASPGESTADRLTRPYGALAPSEIHDHPPVSTAVVSKVLARSANDQGRATCASCRLGGCSAAEF